MAADNGEPRMAADEHGYERIRRPRWQERMPIDPELLEILACPNCKTKVDLVKNGTALKCSQCRRVYPIKDDIPVMLIDEATIEP
jgi:uncharacterized protein YbaR (Trm112 family)